MDFFDTNFHEDVSIDYLTLLSQENTSPGRTGGSPPILDPTRNIFTRLSYETKIKQSFKQSFNESLREKS